MRGYIFGDAFLWLNRQSSFFNDAFRVGKVILAMYLLLFTRRVTGEKKFSVMRELIEKFSVMRDWYPTLLQSWKYRSKFSARQEFIILSKRLWVMAMFWSIAVQYMTGHCPKLT